MALTWQYPRAALKTSNSAANLLASGKSDPSGPEYLLMTSVCQPFWWEECSESEERGAAGGGGGGSTDGKRAWEMGRGTQGQQANPVSPLQHYTKDRTFTEVLPEDLSCHWPTNRKLPTKKRVADFFISTDDELCTSSCSVLMLQNKLHMWLDERDTLTAMEHL